MQLWTGLDVGSVAVFELETGWDLPGKNAGHDDCTWYLRSFPFWVGDSGVGDSEFQAALPTLWGMQSYVLEHFAIVLCFIARLFMISCNNDRDARAESSMWRRGWNSS